MLTSDGKVTCKFGPFKSAILGLEWGPNGHLYIDLGTRLLTTHCDESQPLLELHAETNTALSVSSNVSFLALGVGTPASGFQVCGSWAFTIDCLKRRVRNCLIRVLELY